MNHSRQLELAVPPSRIASLSAGEFVGLVADDPDCPIALKAFHARIINDHARLNKEQQHYRPLPQVRETDTHAVDQHYLGIRQEVMDLVRVVQQRILNDPSAQHLLGRRR
jgi:hypothetical protein